MTYFNALHNLIGETNWVEDIDIHLAPTFAVIIEDGGKTRPDDRSMLYLIGPRIEPEIRL